jgi:hypothetical protein
MGRTRYTLHLLLLALRFTFVVSSVDQRPATKVREYSSNTKHRCPHSEPRSHGPLVENVWNVTAHAQKPDLVFRRNGRVHLNRRGRQFSQLLAADVCASALVMLDTPRSEVVWRVLATHSIRQFPFHFPSPASPSAIRFQTGLYNPETRQQNEATSHVAGTLSHTIGWAATCCLGKPFTGASYQSEGILTVWTLQSSRVVRASTRCMRSVTLR